MHKRYSIHKTSEHTWELRCVEGDSTTTLGAFEDGLGYTGEQTAASALGALLRESMLAADSSSDGEDGVLLPESWSSPVGVAFSEKLPGGRDFTDCAWSWRDPEATMSPLMFLPEETEYGHLGAQLAGFTTEYSLAGGTVKAKGRFFNSEVGIQARDAMSALKQTNGAAYGVSVGPTENLDIEYSDECTEWDEDGFCTAGEFLILFKAYEIGSLTMCTPAGFEGAGIVLDDEAAASAKATPKVAASAAPTKPERAWFELTEPKLGEKFLNGVGDDFLVEQDDGIVACPLQISPPGFEGLVFGNLATWGQCHPGMAAMGCVSPPQSPTSYAHFHVGYRELADGNTIPTGPLTVGCDHAPQMDAPGARDHYANAGLSWADVRASDGEYGPWVSGVLRPDLTEAQVQMLRALSLSGDWVTVGGELDLVGALAVNTPAYAITREAAKPQAVRASLSGGKVRKLVAANIVRRCPECEKRARAGASLLSSNGVDLREMHATLKVIERRTRHLIPAEAAAARARLADA